MPYRDKADSSLRVVSWGDVRRLVVSARGSPRSRDHLNIHTSYEDLCQRFLNAMERETYIQPHNHTKVGTSESLFALRGLMALVTFDDVGGVKSVVKFGSEKYGLDNAVGLVVGPNVWHTVVALESGSVLLEVKPGPYVERVSKDFAPWAPVPGSSDSELFLQDLRKRVAEL